MPEFLSEQWLQDLDAAVRASTAVSALGPIVIEQVVAFVPRRGEVRYRLVVDADGALVVGNADSGPADVRLSTDYRTAVAIAAGKENAQIALADGRLRLGGNVDALVRRSEAFGALDDATAALREVTELRVAVGSATMWGEVTPAERLRSVTRRNVDDDHLAVAAADALAGFADEPASLVVACRRVLAHHRAHGALWWVCCRILAAPDPAAAARLAVRELEADRTGDRLGATLPLLDEGEVVAFIGYTSTIDDALVERFDIVAVAVRVDGDDPVRALRRRRSDQAVRVVDEWDPVLEHTGRLLVSATAIGPERALVPTGSGSVLDTLGTGAAEVWLVGGVGRVSPARVYDTVASSLPPDADFEEISVQRFDRIVGPRGLERPHDATARIDSPVVPELLRPLG